MHIMEGFLPVEWCIIWYIISVIVVIIGIIQLKRVIDENPDAKKILAVNGILMFVVSIFKFPSLEGCDTSPATSGLSGSLFGPAITSVVVTIVLLLQAFLLAYGGITTLGANVFAMGIVGPFAAAIVYHLLNRINFPNVISLIFAVIFANVFSIAATALQYTLAFGESFIMFFVILMVPEVFMIAIDVIVSLIVFLVLKSKFGDSDIFSHNLNDFLKIR